MAGLVSGLLTFNQTVCERMGSQVKKVDGTFSPPTLHITTESPEEIQEEVDTPVIIKSIKEELQKFHRPKSPNIERLTPGKSINSVLK